MTLAEFTSFMDGFRRFHCAEAETPQAPSLDAYVAWKAERA